MSTDMKPCPFCGGTDLKSGGDDKIVGTWCLTCQAHGPNHYGGYQWDDRADATRDATIERLQADLVAEAQRAGPLTVQEIEAVFARAALDAKP